MGGRLFPPHLYALCRAARHPDTLVSRMPDASALSRQAARRNRRPGIMPLYFALCRQLLEYEQSVAVVVVKFEFVARYLIGRDLCQCRFVCRFGGT